MSEAKVELGVLPEWDLTDLYPGTDSPELASAFDEAAPRPSRPTTRASSNRYRVTRSGLPWCATRSSRT